MNNRETYDRIFCELFHVDKTALGADFTFSATEVWDSVAHLALVEALEDAFDVMFETEDILNFGGYENGLAILRRYGVELEA